MLYLYFYRPKTMVRYKVTLTIQERGLLEAIIAKGKHTSMQFRNACILLNSDEGEVGAKWTNEQIAGFLRITSKTVERLKQRFIEDGFEACMDRKPYPEVKDVKTDGDFEAHLVALSCSKAPEGYAHWSLRMLADKMVELNYVDAVSYETVRRVLKKTKLSRGVSKVG
jgi:Homeodomain-like domain